MLILPERAKPSSLAKPCTFLLPVESARTSGYFFYFIPPDYVSYNLTSPNVVVIVAVI